MTENDMEDVQLNFEAALVVPDFKYDAPQTISHFPLLVPPASVQSWR